MPSLMQRVSRVVLRTGRRLTRPDGGVTFRRGTKSFTCDEAGLGDFVNELEQDQDNANFEWTKQTVFVAVEDYDFGDGPVQPNRGDTFEINHVSNKGADVLLTFEVMPSAPEPAWRYSDPDRIEYRIHGKLTKEEPAQ